MVKQAVVVKEEASTAVATTGGKNAFEQYAEATTSNKIIGDLLKFSKGEYLAGQNAEDIAVGTRVIAIMPSMYVGWTRWQDNKPSDYRMGPVKDGFVPPRRSDLGDNDQDLWEIDDQTGKPRDPWQESSYVVFKAEKGDRLFTFTASSKGARGALSKVVGEYGKHLRMKHDEYPVVALGKDKYKHPNASYGWIQVPDIKVVGWVDRKAADAALSSDTEASEVRKDDGEDMPF